MYVISSFGEQKYPIAPVVPMPTEDQINANPYAPPLTVGPADDLPPNAPSHAARIREQCRTREAGLKQKTLCLVGFFVLFSVVANLGAFGLLGPATMMVPLAVISTIAASAGIAINWGVRRFASWSRIPLIILAIVGLAAFPIGTVFGGLILLELYSPRQPKLLSKEYERIVKATLEMNDRTSGATWLVVFLLIVLVLAILLVSQIPPEIRHSR